MRYQFNAFGFDDRVASGEVDILILTSDPAPRRLRELQGAESQTIQYLTRDAGEVLAECHRYYFVRGARRGQLGASGHPDPKWLLVGEEGWNLGHRDEEECDDCAVWRPRVSAQLAEEGADGGTR